MGTFEFAEGLGKLFGAFAYAFTWILLRIFWPIIKALFGLFTNPFQLILLFIGMSCTLLSVITYRDEHQDQVVWHSGYKYGVPFILAAIINYAVFRFRVRAGMVKQPTWIEEELHVGKARELRKQRRETRRSGTRRPTSRRVPKKESGWIPIINHDEGEK